MLKMKIKVSLMKLEIFFATAVVALSVGLAGCDDSSNDSGDNKNSTITHVLDAVSSEGVLLPYTVLRDDLIDNKTQKAFEVRNGGYGSAMTAHPQKAAQFYALTDRGPNASFSGGYGKGKKFPTPDYTPRIGLFEVMGDGSVELRKTILLKDRNGHLISGLPNSSSLGGTGETPYNADGSPVLVAPGLPYDEVTNPIKLDDYGLDGEGLVALTDGTFWVSDEYGPHIVHYNAEGIEIDRINAFANDERVKTKLPGEYVNRRANRGMEGLAITPDEKTLVGIMQSTIYNPSKVVKNLDVTRIVTINLDTGAIGQYLYKQEKSQNSNSEIVAISDTEFLVLERDGAFLFGGPKGSGAASPGAQKTVYRVDLASGTDLESLGETGKLSQDEGLGLLVNGQTVEQVVLDHGWQGLAEIGILPVEKTLVVDMVSDAQYPHDKMEGLWLIDGERLGVLNDDDFATWSTGGQLEQKMLDAGTVDGNRLYIVKGLDLKSHK